MYHCTVLVEIAKDSGSNIPFFNNSDDVLKSETGWLLYQNMNIFVPYWHLLNNNGNLPSVDGKNVKY